MCDTRNVSGPLNYPNSNGFTFLLESKSQGDSEKKQMQFLGSGIYTLIREEKTVSYVSNVGDK